MALIRQATAQRPTRPEATPMVMMLLRDTESTAELLESVVLLCVLIVVVMSVLLDCLFKSLEGIVFYYLPIRASPSILNSVKGP